MRPGRLPALLCALVVAAAAAPAVPAFAQSSGDSGAQAIDTLPPDAAAALKALLAGTNPQASSPSGAGSGSGAGAGSGGSSIPEADGGGATPADSAPQSDDAPIPDQLSPTSPPPVAQNSATATTPEPPPYLTAGQDAKIQPVSSVARLSDPAVPLEPVRIAALIAALLALLALAAAGALRAMGLRTAAPTAPSPALAAATHGSAGPATRLRERTGLLFDDVRDFLRRSR